MTEQHGDSQWGTVEYLRQVSTLNPVQQVKQLTIHLLEVHSGQHILDLGCGTGEDVRALAQHVGPNGSVFGVDIREEVIHEAIQRHHDLGSHVQFMHGDAYQLNFDDNFFDGCRADRLFQHLERPGDALREMVRVTRAGGHVVVADVDWETLIVDVPENKATTRAVLNTHCDSIANGWSGRGLARLFAQAGLVDIQVVPLTGVITDFPLADSVFSLSESAQEAVRTGRITEDARSAWVAALHQAAQEGHFLSAITSFQVGGRVP